MRVKLQSSGRGRGYSVWRGLLESALQVAYAGDWPARLWGAVPASTEVTLTRRSFDLAPGDGPSCRVAFVTDLHVGPTTPPALLESTFERIRSEAPDILLLGGDYVFLEAEPHRLAVLGGLIASVVCGTKLAVLGNHDLWTDDTAIVRMLTGAGARVLVNEAAPLPRPWEDVVVAGLDDPWTGLRDARAALAGLDGAGFRVVLCHSPDGLQQLGDVHFDIFLAGHTHGGHVATPWGPVVLPHGPLCRSYPSGFGRFNSGTVYVSRGIGGIELPFRTFAPPDLLLLELRRTSGHADATRGPEPRTGPGV
jgi:predicted MPP superfamily phosphohydrolase